MSCIHFDLKVGDDTMVCHVSACFCLSDMRDSREHAKTHGAPENPKTNNSAFVPSPFAVWNSMVHRFSACTLWHVEIGVQQLHGHLLNQTCMRVIVRDVTFTKWMQRVVPSAIVQPYSGGGGDR